MKDKRMMDGTKAPYHLDRIEGYFKKGKRVAPVHIDCGIAKFCNIKCVFCYGKFQNYSKEYIQKEALLSLVKDAKGIGVRSLAFIGDGEPTCNPHLYEALSLARDLKLDMSISTSGVSVDTEEKIETILSSCVWMRYCLAAGTPEGYKKIHGVDRFSKVIGNISQMLDIKESKGYSCDVGLQSVFIPGVMNEEVVHESQLAVDLGVDYFVVKQCSLPDEGQSGMMQFDPKLYDSWEVKDALQQAEELSNDKTKIVVKWNVMDLKGQKAYQGCPGIPLLSEISGNGDWYPCGYMFGGKPEFDEFKFGNLHEQSLREMFESYRYWNIVDKMREIDTSTFCKGCCRQDPLNIWLDKYQNMTDREILVEKAKAKFGSEVKGVNFI